MTEEEAIETAKKIRRSRPDRTEACSVHTQPGEMSRQIQNALAVSALAPIDTDDPVQVANRVQEYFNLCAEREMKPSVIGMALSLGVDRRTLWSWRTGTRPKSSAVVDIIKRAYDVLELLINEWMMNGNIQAIPGIFLSKNLFGYSDQSEVIVTPKTPLGEPKSREEIERKYLESVDDPDESDIIYDSDGAENDDA